MASYKDILTNGKNQQMPHPQALDPKAYQDVVDKVREQIVNDQKENIKDFIGTEQGALKLQNYIEAILAEQFSDYVQYTKRIYEDIFEFAFINRYLEDPTFEEMNGNSWQDIEVISSNGYSKIKDHFSSAEHAKNIIKKMMAIGGAILDEAQPSLDSYIGTGLRLTGSITPIADDDVGVTFSLRKLSGRQISKEDLVEKYDSYSQEEIEFIELCLEHGISVLFGGATSSGKSSDMQTVLYSVFAKGEARGYIIEENTRELDFIIHDEAGNTVSRVIHTKTRPSNTANTLNVNSDLLVKTSLRYHPDIIVPAEMRGEEAMSAIESALTGHTIATSCHVQSVTKAYERILMLCQKANNNLSEDMLMTMIVEALPIVVFKKQLREDKSRRCMKIFEATGYDKTKQKIVGRILYQFLKTGESVTEGKRKVIGKHQKVSDISYKLCQKLFENGCDLDVIRRYNPSFEMIEGVDYIEDFIEDVSDKKVGEKIVQEESH